MSMDSEHGGVLGRNHCIHGIRTEDLLGCNEHEVSALAQPPHRPMDGRPRGMVDGSMACGMAACKPAYTPAQHGRLSNQLRKQLAPWTAVRDDLSVVLGLVSLSVAAWNVKLERERAHPEP